MRKGYWKTLLSRLRGRVEQGNNLLRLGSITFVLHELCALDDAPLERDTVIVLALATCGDALLVDPATTEINMRIDRTGEVIASGMTLLDMIDKLRPGLASDAGLTALPDDERILDRIMRGKSSRARGVFDDD